MHQHSSSSGLERKTSRRRFTKAAVLAPVVGLLSATAFSAHPLLAQAQTHHALGLQQAQSATGSWWPTSSLSTAQWRHTATLLPNGKVLVAAGFDNSGAQATAYLYDPASGTWTQTGSMPAARGAPTATLLPNGQVLVAGGYQDGGFDTGQATAYLYDPATGTWTQTGSMLMPRGDHTATLLANGKVLVAGGIDNNLQLTPIAELYDPATGTWTQTGSMLTPLYFHTATLLSTGKVLVTGGWTAYKGTVVSAAELYDPATGSWTSTGSMNQVRQAHTATLLPNGQVLVVGDSPDQLSAELYDPASGTWTPTGSMNTPRNEGHTATLLPNGQVLVTGGFNSSGITASAELYDPASGTWTATGSMTTVREGHTATLLPNGHVLVVGGARPDANGHLLVALATAEYFDPLAPPPSLNGTYQGLLMGSGGRAFTSITLQVTQVGSALTGTLTVQGEPLSLISGSTMSSTGLVVIRARSSSASVSLNGAMLNPGGHLSGSYTGFFPSSFPGSGTWTLTQV